MIAVNAAAIILAAGVSSRMGKFKPLLPLGNKTVIERIVAMFLHAGVRDVRVVLGYKARDVIAVLKNLGVSWCINDDYPSEMFTSVKVGLGGLKQDAEAFFVLPVDIPLVKAQTLQWLMGGSAKDTHQIMYPTFLGERGHPPLISRHYARELMTWAGKGGLKGFLEQYDHNSRDVPVFDEGILMDMDTPSQYREIVTRYEKRQVPTKAEITAMMTTRFSADHRVVKHSKVVARVARVVGEKLLNAGHKIDVSLVDACGYLHDIGKGEKQHAKFGARLLKSMGYPQVADIIVSHMDLSFAEEGNITEKEVVYLADKLTYGEKILPLDKRLKSKLNQLTDQTKGKVAAEKRIRTAMQIEHAIEKIVGEKLSVFL